MITLDDGLHLANLRHAVGRLADAAEHAAFACNPPGGCEAKKSAYRVLASLRLALLCLTDAEHHHGELARLSGEGRCDA